MCEVQRADLGRHAERNASARSNGGNEAQPHAELAELDGDRRRTSSRGALDHRERELAASQKTSLLAILGQHVRLGQNFEKAAALQQLDGCAQIQVGTEEKHIK